MMVGLMILMTTGFFVVSNSLVGTVIVLEVFSVISIYVLSMMPFSSLVILIMILVLDSTITLSMIVLMSRFSSSDKLLSFSW